MATRVGVLRCRYRLPGRAPDPHEVHRLDRLAAGSVPAELERALGEMGDGAAVYVVRRVRAATVVDPGAQADPALARGWGRDLAHSVVRAIDEGIGDGSRVVRFRSEAEFVAAFVADLLAGSAWRRWYFGAFARHRHRGVPEAIAAVFGEHADLAPAVLAALADRGMLEPLLVRVDPAALGLGVPAPAIGPPDGAADAWRPIVAAAVRVADVLGLWPAAAPEPAALTRSWADGAPRQPDWRDRAALADAVAAAVGWLVARGAARAPAPHVELAPRQEAAVAALDWLDVPRLIEALSRIGAARAGLPTRGPAPTPRRRAVLAAVIRAVEARHPELGPAAAGDPKDAVRLLAALAAVDPETAAGPLARAGVDGLGGARAAGAPPARPGAAPVAAAPPGSLDPTAAAGPDEVSVAAVLHVLGPAAADEPVASPCAGVLLLARALLDVRLAGLAQRHGYPPAGPAHLLAAVGLRVAGPTGVIGGSALDPAVRLLAGDGAPGSSGELVAAWADVPAAAHDHWRAVLDELRVRHRVDPAAEAGDAGGNPLGDALDDTADAVLRVWARWLRGFDRSSPSFLLDRFLRRPGALVVEDDVVRVLLPPGPLDVVLEMSGYLRPVEPLPGTPGRRIEFEVGARR